MRKKLIIGSMLLFVSTLLLSNLESQVVTPKTREYKKAIRQRTREYKKQGYTPMGSGSIELYVTRGVNKEFETDENGQAKYNVVTTKEVGPTFESASTACRASARVDIAANIETRVAELVKRSVANDEITEKEADGINKVIAAGKQLIAQQVSMEDIYTFYRPIKDSRSGEDIVEVLYSACYSKRLAMEKTEQYVRKELKNETEDLHKNLDKIFNLPE